MLKKIILFAAVLCIFSVPALSQTIGAKIIKSDGDVKVRQPESAQWISANKGMLLKNGGSIKTQKDSSAEIAVSDDLKNIISIEENSEFTLEDAAAKKASLKRGKILALLGPASKKSRFQLRTPTAVCGVAGSGMFAQAGENNTTTGCYEDKSYAQGINKDGSLTEEKIIEEGYKCTIEQFSPPGELMPLDQEEQDEWYDFKENMSENMRDLQKPQEDDAQAEDIEQAQGLENENLETRNDDRLEKDEEKRRDDAMPESSGGSQGSVGELS
ncbi:MAG: FecR domain-containing protein [Candidatus Omnitrophica bacterium]|nr:FecR domain-containing protein [Candidatus Omnitrophota bacterium]